MNMAQTSSCIVYRVYNLYIPHTLYYILYSTSRRQDNCCSVVKSGVACSVMQWVCYTTRSVDCSAVCRTLKKNSGSAPPTM